MIIYSKTKAENKEFLTLFDRKFLLCNDINKKYNHLNKKDIESRLKLKYFLKFKRNLNLKSPKYFTEKIQWLKLYDCKPIKTTLADKILVRNWIKEKIGEEYLKKIYGIYNSFEEINFSELPQEYAIKANHGCNMQLLVIEGGKFDYESTKKRFNGFLKTNYAYKSGFEMQYRDIKPLLFTEEYIKNTNEIYEYLFFCFNGKAEYVLFASNKRTSNVCCTMFDINWNNLHFNYGGTLHKHNIPKPDNFDKMVEIAETLSKGFIFVRVDLHNVNGKIYFGEMTFTPASGYMFFNPAKYDRILGDKLYLPK